MRGNHVAPGMVSAATIRMHRTAASFVLVHTCQPVLWVSTGCEFGDCLVLVTSILERVWCTIPRHAASLCPRFLAALVVQCSWPLNDFVIIRKHKSEYLLPVKERNWTHTEMCLRGCLLGVYGPVDEKGRSLKQAGCFRGCRPNRNSVICTL